MINILSVTYQPYDFSTGTTDYLLGEFCERIEFQVEFIAEWSIQADADFQRMDFIATDKIQFIDDEGDSVPGIWENNEFRVGDTIEISGTAAGANDGTFGPITAIDEDTGTATIGGAPGFTIQTDDTALVEGKTDLTGCTYQWNFIENDSAESYNSLIDGNEYRYTKDGLTSTSFVSMEREGNYESNNIGTVEIKKVTGTTNRFILKHLTTITPFMDPQDVAGFRNNTAPEWYFNDACLKHIYKLKLHKHLDNPNYIQETDAGIFQLGNTGERDERFNGGSPEYTLTSTVFKDAGDNVITNPDFNLVNKVEIVIDSASGKFSDGNTNFTLQHFYLPENEDEYKDTTTDLETNFMFDQCDPQTLGAAAIDGRGDGTDKQVLQNIVGTFNDANTMTITAEINLSSDYKARLEASEDAYFYLGVTTQDHTLDTEGSDKVHVQCANTNYITDKSNDSVGLVEEVTFLDGCATDTLISGSTNPGVFVEDWQIAKGIFYVDTTNGAIIKSVNVQIYADNATYGSFDLELTQYDTESVPVVSGVQVISISGERGYQMKPGNMFNDYSISRRSDLDSGNNKYYEILYPFKIRWEDFIRLSNVSDQFYNPLLQQSGFNNDWARYYATAGWTLYFKLDLTIRENEFDNSISSEYTLEAHDYGDASDWDYQIRIFDVETGLEITGNVLADKPCDIKAYFQKTSGTPPSIGDCWGFLGIAAYRAGGDKIIREVHTVWQHESDSPWISLTNNKLCKKEKVGSDYILSARLDNEQLKVLFPDATSFDISARLDESCDLLPTNAKLFEDGEPFLFEDGQNYLFDE